ncbi:hypothetical protein TNCT_364871 [Trichonephila clavata]|uniref:Uncharacterized protein n=1 Tax=Trichonephila clavata TaxID=2740835 RepID=A0A8X6GD92_TRICU|nr:hypothetical protein TNCT_364871 [Trichonephila clavata]
MTSFYMKVSPSEGAVMYANKPPYITRSVGDRREKLTGGCQEGSADVGKVIRGGSEAIKGVRRKQRVRLEESGSAEKFAKGTHLKKFL